MSIDDLLKSVFSLAEDHKPEGWPAIRTKEITQLADEVVKLREDNKSLRDYIASLMSTMPKIKADVVREAAVYLESQTQTSKTDYVLLNEYADKLERDE